MTELPPGASPVDAITPGTRLREWEVVRFRARGAYGVVFEARRSSWLDEPPRALKVFDPIVSRAARHALLGEFQTLTAVRHPHLLTGIDAFDLDEPPFAGCVVFVLELAEEDLSHRIAHSGRLAGAEAAAIGAEVATGLAALHEKGRIHGDVKPENILRVEDRWVVGDFGVTSVLEGSYAFLPGTTIDYRPPELASAPEGSRLHRSADVWALGVSLYMAVTGRHPFPGPDPMMRYTAVVRGDRIPLPPDVEGPLAWLIETGCLAPDPHQRLDAATLATQLRNLAPAPPGGSATAGQPAGPPAASFPDGAGPGGQPAPSTSSPPGAGGSPALAPTGPPAGAPPGRSDSPGQPTPAPPGTPVGPAPGGSSLPGLHGTPSGGQLAPHPGYGPAGVSSSGGWSSPGPEALAPVGPWIVGAAVVALVVAQVVALVAGELSDSVGSRRAIYVVGSLAVLGVVTLAARAAERPSPRQLLGGVAAGLAVWAVVTAQLMLGVVG